MHTDQDIHSAIESALAGIPYPKGTPGLFEPVKYMLDGGGKRLRPRLLLSAFSALSGRDISEAMPQALALEMFHNFTLLHDDVMDRADVRHGRPTVHRRWNESAAILSGDAMLTLATNLVAQVSEPSMLAPLLSLFNTTAMEVYQGQQLDMEFESKAFVSVADYMEMIRLKTSVLLACACRMGAMLAGASDDVCSAFYDYGIALGLAFQLRDDWLDTFGDPAEFGKAIGGDIVNNKKTWLLITGLTEARDDLGGILAEDLEPEVKISQVVKVYRRLSLDERCMKLTRQYLAKAIDSLGRIPMDEEWRQYFTDLASRSANRTR